MKTDKIHQGLLSIKQHIKNVGAEHKALMSRSEKIISIVESLLDDERNAIDEHSTARLKKLARLFLDIEDGLNKELGSYSQDIQHIIGDNGALHRMNPAPSAGREPLHPGSGFTCAT